MGFFLEFTLISYASIVFFAVGLRLALSPEMDLSLLRLLLIFLAVAIPLSLAFMSQPLADRLWISIIWTSVIGIGFRFGRRIVRK